MSKYNHFLNRLARAYWKLVKPRTLGVRAIILDESGENVLLVRHTYTGGLYLPGGGVKKFEKPEDAIARELKEELGYAVTGCDLFGVYSNFTESKSDTVIVVTCTGQITENIKSNEIESFGFFDIHDLPKETSPGTRKRIGEYVSGKSCILSTW